MCTLCAFSCFLAPVTFHLETVTLTWNFFGTHYIKSISAAAFNFVCVLPIYNQTQTRLPAANENIQFVSRYLRCPFSMFRLIFWLSVCHWKMSSLSHRNSLPDTHKPNLEQYNVRTIIEQFVYHVSRFCALLPYVPDVEDFIYCFLLGGSFSCF